MRRRAGGPPADVRGPGRRPPEDRPARRSWSRKANDLAFEGVRERLYRMAGVDLTVLEAVDEGTALAILAEVSTDVSRFPTAKHFTSWLSLCPQHRGSAGRIKSRGVRRGATRAGRALRLSGVDAVGWLKTERPSWNSRIPLGGVA